MNYFSLNPVAFELWSLDIQVVWGFSGYYQKKFLGYYVRSGARDLIRKFGILLLYVYGGLYGGKEIGALLKMWSAHQLSCKHPSLFLFICGLLYRVSQLVTLFISS